MPLGVSPRRVRSRHPSRDKGVSSARFRTQLRRIYGQHPELFRDHLEAT